MGTADVKVLGSIDGRATCTAKDGIEAGTMILKDINPDMASGFDS